jgi:transposase
VTARESLPTDLAAALKLEIEKLRRQLYGTRSERKARLLEQMELQLEELEAAATEDELAAEKAAAQTQTVQSFQRKRPARKPFPAHLPRERVVIAHQQLNDLPDLAFEGS